MNNLSRRYWEKIYSSEIIRYPDYDEWLDKHLLDLRKAESIVDLGCGNGVNALYLHNNNIEVIACDFSKSALKQLTKKAPDIVTLCFDMTKEFPFENASTDVVIADLSIHYFDWNTTKKIVSEVFRILKNNGLFLCRLNSTNEYSSEKNDQIIEDNYYFNGENYKRFFNKNNILSLFSDYQVYYIAEGITNKYGNEKHVWEVAVKRKGKG